MTTRRRSSTSPRSTSGGTIGLIVDVARRSRVHVIVATGVWWMPPRYFGGHGVDEVAALFIRDITQGIGESGVKAAIIKCATDTAGVTPVIENDPPRLRAGPEGDRRADLDPHLGGGPHRPRAAGDLRPGGRRPPPRHHRPQRRQRGPGLPPPLMERGQHDRHGPLRPRALPADGEARRGDRPPGAEGYAARMVLSHDANCWSDMLSEDDKRRTRPQWHYNHIPDDILPALRQARASATTRSTRCWSATRARSSRPAGPAPGRRPPDPRGSSAPRGPEPARRAPSGPVWPAVAGIPATFARLP